MKNVLVLLSLLVLVACKQEQKEANENHLKAQKTTESKDVTTKESLPDKLDKQILLGDWSGSFGNKQIAVKLTKVINDTIYGINTVGTNSREIKGIYKLTNKGKLVKAKLLEPGDNKYDGAFTLDFNLENKTATGNWNPLKGASRKELRLEKQSEQKTTEKAINIHTANIEEIEFVSDEKDFTLKGKWHGIYGRHNYDWYVRIDDVIGNVIKGVVKDGLNNTVYDIEGELNNNNGLYSGKLTETKRIRRQNKPTKQVKVQFNTNERLGNYDGIKIDKYASTENGLLKDIGGIWEGQYQDKNNNSEHFKLFITKIVGNDITGYTLMESDKNGTRKKSFSGKLQKREDKFNDNIAISVDEEDFKGVDNGVFVANGAFHLRYLNDKIDGVWIINGVELNVDLHKTKRIKQSDERINEINANIEQLEKHAVKLFGLYDEVLRANTLTVSGKVTKVKTQLQLLDNYTKTHSIPNDASKLTYKQEERMSNIKAMLLNYAMNSKLQRRLNGGR